MLSQIGPPSARSLPQMVYARHRKMQHMQDNVFGAGKIQKVQRRYMGRMPGAKSATTRKRWC